MRVGDREHDAVADRLELEPPEHEQLRERVVDAVEVLGGRDVVVHEHDRLGPRQQERRDRRLADRSVVHEQAARTVARRTRCSGRTSSAERGRDVPGEHLGRTDAAQHVAVLERDVRDRVTRGRRREDLMDAELAAAERRDVRHAAPAVASLRADRLRTCDVHAFGRTSSPSSRGDDGVVLVAERATPRCDRSSR